MVLWAGAPPWEARGLCMPKSLVLFPAGVFVLLWCCVANMSRFGAYVFVMHSFVYRATGLSLYIYRCPIWLWHVSVSSPHGTSLLQCVLK